MNSIKFNYKLHSLLTKHHLIKNCGKNLRTKLILSKITQLSNRTKMNKPFKTSKKNTTNSTQKIKASGRMSSVLSSQSQIYAINRLLIKKASKKT